MEIKADSVADYISQCPKNKVSGIEQIRNIFLSNLPRGFEETMCFGMIGYVVPHSIYPKGYHVDSKIPLPFINLGVQKHHIAIYHSGLYADLKLLAWFKKSYSLYSTQKLDMGKCCIRFKNMNHIPYPLIETLAQKISVSQWIALYEKLIKKK